MTADESAIQKAAVERLIGKPVKGQPRRRGDGLTGAYPELLLLTTFRGQAALKGEAGRMKGEGACPGYPDLFLPVARGPFHALFVEVKTIDGRVRRDQREIHELLRAQGNAVVVARSVDGIVAVFRCYLGFNPYDGADYFPRVEDRVRHEKVLTNHAEDPLWKRRSPPGR